VNYDSARISFSCYELLAKLVLIYVRPSPLCVCKNWQALVRSTMLTSLLTNNVTNQSRWKENSSFNCTKDVSYSVIYVPKAALDLTSYVSWKNYRPPYVLY